jgi:hypothetical protein
MLNLKELPIKGETPPHLILSKTKGSEWKEPRKRFNTHTTPTQERTRRYNHSSHSLLWKETRKQQRVRLTDINLKATDEQHWSQRMFTEPTEDHMTYLSVILGKEEEKRELRTHGTMEVLNLSEDVYGRSPWMKKSTDRIKMGVRFDHGYTQDPQVPESHHSQYQGPYHVTTAKRT